MKDVDMRSKYIPEANLILRGSLANGHGFSDTEASQLNLHISNRVSLFQFVLFLPPNVILSIWERSGQ